MRVLVSTKDLHAKGSAPEVVDALIHHRCADRVTLVSLEKSIAVVRTHPALGMNLFAHGTMLLNAFMSLRFTQR